MTRKRCVLFAAVLAVLAGSVLAWTQTSAMTVLDIAPPKGSGGKLVKRLTSVGGTFSFVPGPAQKISGIQLYEIELWNSLKMVKIDLVLENAHKMGAVLNNPTAFIDVGIWYPVQFDDAQDTAQLDNGQMVWRDNYEKASAVMSKTANAAVFLYPSKTDTVTSTLYILASIVVGQSKTGYPPGQQGQLKFWCQVTTK